MQKELDIEGRDEGYGRTWTDMDNGKIEYFDADCADYAGLRKGVKLVVSCEKDFLSPFQGE